MKVNMQRRTTNWLCNSSVVGIWIFAALALFTRSGARVLFAVLASVCFAVFVALSVASGRCESCGRVLLGHRRTGKCPGCGVDLQE